MRPTGWLVACLAFVQCGEPRAEPAPIELDHVYVVVPAKPVAELAALAESGFAVGSRVTRHVGAGTASLAILFENAYVELLWPDATVPVDDAERDALEGFRRAAASALTGKSPFGIGLRRTTNDGAALGVPTRRYSAAWMEPNSYIELLTGTDEPAASDLFVVPSYMAMPSLTERLADRPELFAHRPEAHRISFVSVHGPETHEPRAYRALQPSLVRFVRADVPLLEVELDGGARNERLDLRPLLPLVFLR